MTTEVQQFAASQASTHSGRPLDRRRFMESAAAVGAILSLDATLFDGAFAAPSKGAFADSRLPDGTEFVSWEQPLTFSKTYYVDTSAPNADDNGPGDKARPFRTIS